MAKMTEAQKAAKAARNRDYRARRTKREQAAQQEARALRANRDIDPTREEWLTRAAKLILAKVENLGGYKPTGDVRVSISFLPKGRKSVTKGRCYHAAASQGGYREIFISAELTDVREILGTLTHEIGHAVLKDGVGHRKPFKIFCEMVGFDFEKAETAHDGVVWWAWASGFAKELGPIPHKRLDLLNAQGEKKKQSTRMLKCECPDCGLIWRMARKPIVAIMEAQQGQGGDAPYLNCVDPDCACEINIEEMLAELAEGGEEEE